MAQTEQAIGESGAAPVVRVEVVAGPHAGMVVVLSAGEHLIGRAPHARLSFAHDLLVSVEHCRLAINEHGCLLEDLGTRHGTLVNGTRVTRTWIKPGDRISIGMSELAISFASLSATDPTAPLGASSPPVVESHGSATTSQSSAGFLPIPGYTLIRKIGAGGMGVVYEARSSDGSKVAIKTIIPTAGTSLTSIALFKREMKVLSQLEHPRIVKFIEAGESAGQVFLAMEYVECIDIVQRMASLAERRRIAVACGLVCQILDALQYAHDRKLVHRDVKPGNILVSLTQNRLSAKLADFGLAKNFELAGLSQLTGDDELRGTPAFMPQEQWISSRYAKPSADIYSAAASLFYLLTGTSPKPAPRQKKSLSQLTSLFQTSQTVVPEAAIELEPLQTLREIPAGLLEAIQRGLAANPRQRFATAAEMRAALLPFVRS